MATLAPKAVKSPPRLHTTSAHVVSPPDDVTRGHHVSSRRSQRVGREVKLEPVEEEMQVYEWPDLPPIGHIKNAIARQRVSQGVSYILPVHKTKSSVENVYRTNLRVMFQEPYLHEDPRAYDEVKLNQSMKHHFVPNKASSPVVPKHQKREMGTDHYQLNAESEKVRQLYNQSAPSTGVTGRCSIQMDNLRQRSSLFLPIKAKIPPEAARLKAEAEKILRSVQDEQEQRFDSSDSNPRPIDISTMPTAAHTRKSVTGDILTQLQDGSRRRASSLRLHRLSTPNIVAFAMTPEEKEQSSELQMTKKASMFNSYDALKTIRWPDKRHVPEDLPMPYVSQEKASDIWQWLHRGEDLNEFTYFLQVCS